ncbi:hypothetical protein WMY93_024037 [Mugilogobius chulae]|uniref:Craniofacial development protein 1 n=1 Tax=Mugilogobius chulae TaxID=88201 RepID=A0AAW0NIB8_9GOBI
MMNYSDYDSDGYSSNEDADYVPSVENAEEDKTKVGETDQLLNEETPHHQEEDEVKQKQKSDDLWASFLFDVGSRPKQPTAATNSDTTPKADIQSSSVITASPKTETKPSEPAKVTITKVFDFAGEEVRVNKEVAADSREARSFLKSQSNNETEEESSSQNTSSATASSVKRPAGLSGIMGRIGGKKQKMSTLEKSKMDWDAFKSEEGISEELAIHNRGREGMWSGRTSWSALITDSLRSKKQYG